MRTAAIILSKINFIGDSNGGERETAGRGENMV